MSSPTGFLGITLEGVRLTDEAATQEPTERRRELKTIQEGGPGGAREQLAWQPAGYPVRTYRRSWRFSWRSLRGLIDKMEELLAGPGPFELCFWKYVHYVYTGDGSRVEFFAPHAIATHTLAETPGGRPISEYEPVVKIGIDGTPLSNQLVAAEDYEDDPDTGEVWFLQGTSRFKVSTAPASGQELHLRYVPLYSVIETEETERRYPSPVSEPRDISLIEAEP